MCAEGFEVVLEAKGSRTSYWNDLGWSVPGNMRAVSQTLLHTKQLDHNQAICCMSGVRKWISQRILICDLVWIHKQNYLL